MVVINLLAFLTAVLLLTQFFQESILTVLPMTACGLIFVLYLLAYAGHLSWIDGIGAGLLFLTVVWLLAGRRRKVCEKWAERLTEPSFLAAMLLLAVVSVCVSAKAVTWWDDVNFWATDVKSIYFLDGFAGKYRNVASEFGDYPPGAQLFKWWFLHFDKTGFREGLAFAGYYCLNLIFLTPLLRKIPGKNPLVFGIACLLLWLMPSIAEVYGYQGFCADLTMACIYGNFLYAVIDREGHKESFYYGRLAAYLGLLVLVKSIGFLWAAFGILFLLMEELRRKERGFLFRLGAVASVPVLTGGSWLCFCVLMRRVTKTTTTAVKYVTTDEYGFSGYMSEFAKAFLKAFFTEPLHKEKGLGIDLTPFALYLLIGGLLIFFFGTGKLALSSGRRILWFVLLSGAVFYAVIFLAHITIFATETQYLEASGMISSIERYGAPFTIGSLIFLAYLWMEKGEVFFYGKGKLAEKYGTVLLFAAFVVLTAQHSIAWEGLIGYRSSMQEELQEREEMLDDTAREFLEAVNVLEQESTRVLCIQKNTGARWVKNSYIGMEAAPVSVVYLGVNLADATEEWLRNEILASHAEYLYVERQEADLDALFETMTGEASFADGSIYRIEEENGGIRLQSVKETDG